MISFILAFQRLVRVLRVGVRDPEFQGLLVAVLGVLAAGIIFYMVEEGWSFIDALYFCVTTLTTIGFGDPAPTSALSKVFTIVYVIIGIGLIAAFITSLADRSRELDRKRRERRTM
jgi:hypothetical protein